MRRNYLYATSFLAGLTVIGPLPAFAQQAAQGGLEEIVVTARKVEENLMVVPMSIAAVTAADIQAAGVKDLQTLSLYTPGLYIQYGVSVGAGTTRQLTFRGLSVSTGQVFVDGAPYAGTGNPSLGSVERVEVLVGPQSAYFGRSTFEGALNFVTKDPGDTFKGQINGEVSKFGTTDDSLTLEGPIAGDKLGMIITARHFSTGGQWQNAANPNETLGSWSNNSVLATLVGKPTDNLKVKVLLGYENEKINGSPPTIYLIGNDKNPGVVQNLNCNLGGTFGPYYCGALPKANQIDPSIISANDVISPQIQSILFNNTLKFPTLFNPLWDSSIGPRQVTLTGHLNIDYSAPSGWDVTSITALHKTKFESPGTQQFRDDENAPNPDFGKIPNVLPYIGFHTNSEGIIYDGSEEIRVSSPQNQRLRGTAGANWFYTRDPGVGDSWGLEPATVTFIGTQSRTSTSTPAVFAGLYFDIVDKVTLGAEGRYQWDKIEAQVVYPLANVGPLLQATYTSFSPRVTLDYKYAPNSDAYVLWSRGYRPGGFNTALVGQPAVVLSELSATGALIDFQQERLDNFEGGLKSTWLNGHVQTRIDAYYDQWRNGQISQTVNVNQPSGGVFVATATTNIGAVNLHGVEFEGAAAVNEHLNVTANFDWQTSKITTYFSAITARINNQTNVNGNVFPNAPILTWTLTPTYTDHLSGDWDWYTRLDWKHRGKYYVDVSNVAWISPSNILDLHIGIKDRNKTIEAYATNLTNDLHFLTAGQANDAICCVAASNVNAITAALPNKRSFGMKATYNF